MQRGTASGRPHRVLVTSRSFSSGHRRTDRRTGRGGVRSSPAPPTTTWPSSPNCCQRSTAGSPEPARSPTLIWRWRRSCGSSPGTGSALTLSISPPPTAAASSSPTPPARTAAPSPITPSPCCSPRCAGVAAGDRRVRDGRWTVQRTRELGGLTVGIIGFGRIGRGVAARLAGFGCRVLACDPFLSAADIAAAGAEPVHCGGAGRASRT